MYFIAFVVLVAVGLGINHLMLRLFRRKHVVGDIAESQDDLLTVETKEALAKDAQDLRAAVSDLTGHITARLRELEAKEAQLKVLIASIDERLAKFAVMQEEKQSVAEAAVCGSARDTYKIADLYQQGMNTTEIARSLGLGIGEVELRLGFMNKFDKA